MVSNNPLMTTESTIATGRGMADPNYTLATYPSEARFPSPQWRSILAGVFVALSLLAVLSVLGLAIGATAYDASTDTRGWGIGAVVWAMISTAIAFAVGGFLCARTLWGRACSGALHGMMVWAVAIPVIGLAAATGIGSLAAGASTNMMWTPTYAERMDTGRLISQYDDDRMTAAGGNADANNANMSMQERLREDTQKAAWATFFTLLLGAVVATAAGAAGAAARKPRREEATPTMAP